LGRGELADVLAGIDWVTSRARHPAYNVRVMNLLSLGMSSVDSFFIDPLARAARGATAVGIAVVAAAGNVGKDPATGNSSTAPCCRRGTSPR
jgi:subtilisin family serine protease